MGFDELELKNEYRSRIENIATEFYYPILRIAKTYDRAVGFFSSTALVTIADGLLPFVNNGGTMRVIASPKLSDEDVLAIKEGYERRENIIARAIERELYEPKDFREENRLALLTMLIEDERLQIKIATVGSYGMYHEKIGIFSDAQGNEIAFSGSMNETYTAMNINYESIDVFCSWKDINEYERVRKKKEAFDLLWDNKDSEVDVQEFVNVDEIIIQKYKKDYSYTDFMEKDFISNDEKFNLKSNEIGGELQQNEPIIKVHLHDYQKEAIESWKNNGYRGIFDMATGTGKTYTGIGALCTLFQDRKRLISIIVCPQTHLVEQWVEDLNIFNIYPIVAYGINKYKEYPSLIRKAIFDYKLGTKNFICIICTKDTFASSKMQKLISSMQGEICLLADEAHNMGARTYLKCLTERYIYRLGLSATFERHNDTEGTEELSEFFGEKCIEYPLERAIKEKKLTPYDYYPILVYLSDEELDSYNKISEEIKKNITFDKKGNPVLNDYVQMLAIKRARIVAGATNKDDTLRREIKPYIHDNHMLVYCGATSEHDEDDDVVTRQIDRICHILGAEYGMKVAQFTSSENAATRDLLKKEFSDGDVLQALVAIKCLDEGVNIPSVNRAFILASTTNPKEYIQRRGRVLRLYEGKDKAYIYDFVTLPRDLDLIPFLSPEEIENDISLVKNELKRVLEFQRIADNYVDSIDVIERIREAYQLFEEEEAYD
ncbi:MAG: DEAD/DEAH box helicase family protein [Pseudobutyrivibrio sp.]|nr:DEAD/DEAH box helicase family protein [Pseudobutyrivibrio sp.]